MPWADKAPTPVVMNFHGDADPLVPYAHAQRLQQAMDKAGEKNSC